jgi:hypothetical protein
MKRLVLFIVVSNALAGCAAYPPNSNYSSNPQDANGVPIDSTYPGSGARVGVGIGTWGGHSLGGVGIGLGW